jgi:pantothenate kinase
VEDGVTITPDCSIIIIEGNYLLLDDPGWRELAGLVDCRVFVDTDPLEARGRLAVRHLKAGIEKTLEDGYRRVDRNDFLNAISIREKLLAPDIVVKSVTVDGT